MGVFDSTTAEDRADCRIGFLNAAA